MADIITEVGLPSKGLLYDKEIQWQNQLKAPRLRDKGLADSTRKLKLQAGILDSTLVQPLGISAYDLHVIDYIYLNMRQRQLSKGSAPYRILVRCKKCEKIHRVPIDLSQLEVVTLKDKPNYTITTMDGDEVVFTFTTPRILDDLIDNAKAFREEYEDTTLSLDYLQTQEYLRLIIKSVNGQKITYAQMTNFIENLYMDDSKEILERSRTGDFGVQFIQSFQCDCGNTVVYEIPIGE